ncbi:hypothetical protein K440DRAFT_45368 [Wilcoxina mikolae CBS 423.85]|nr:hypothetical protein K440DRAFT_45368 [Wilcoxina mikolae CBS 423.85]
MVFFHIVGPSPLTPTWARISLSLEPFSSSVSAASSLVLGRCSLPLLCLAQTFRRNPVVSSTEFDKFDCGGGKHASGVHQYVGNSVVRYRTKIMAKGQCHGNPQWLTHLVLCLVTKSLCQSCPLHEDHADCGAKRNPSNDL